LALSVYRRPVSAGILDSGQRAEDQDDCADSREFIYQYLCADRPQIKWKAVVTLLNGTDLNVANNIMYKKVDVRGDSKACPPGQP